MEVLRASGIKRSYNSGGEAFWALKGIDMSIEQGQLAIIKGISGSGKTTLMNILGALDPPTEGEVYFCGESIARASEHRRDMLRRKDMGFVFQSLALVSMMTAYENVEFILRICGYPAKDRRSRAEACLAMVGLAQRMHHLTQELSGGEQQRVAIARAIAHRPRVIFADEPTAELDTTTGLQVVKVLKDLTEQEGVTIILATHDPDLMFAADTAFELEDGEIIR